MVLSSLITGYEALRDAVASGVTTLGHEAELLERAQRLVPSSRNFSGTEVILVVAGGPRRAVLRPAELEDPQLHRFLMVEALTGEAAVLSPTRGTGVSMRGDSVRLVQEQGIAATVLDEQGSLLVVQPAVERDAWRSSGITSIIEDEIQERLTRALRFSGRVLDHIDGAKRLTHVAVVVAMRGVGHMPWRTREEQDRSPNAATMSMRSTEHVEVMLSPPVRRRAALLHDTQRLAEDFVVRLRREVQG